MDVVEIPARDYADRIEGLAALLHACVHAGASVNFLLPFPVEEARAFWSDKVTPAMQAGTRRLWLAEEAGRIAGCVMLDRAVPPNQAHRAEVTKLLVHPDFRRRGAARALMDRLVAEARAAGLQLLTLDTVSDSPAQAVYAGAGFQVAGSIPAFALSPDRRVLEPTTYMYLGL